MRTITLTYQRLLYTLTTDDERRVVATASGPMMLLRALAAGDIEWPRVERVSESWGAKLAPVGFGDGLQVFYRPVASRSEIGRLGGLARSAAKSRAVRRNGKLGGRPKGTKDAKPRTRRAT